MSLKIYINSDVKILQRYFLLEKNKLESMTPLGLISFLVFFEKPNIWSLATSMLFC